MSEPIPGPAEALQGQQVQPQELETNPLKKPGGEATSSTMINSLADLKEKAPDVYKKMQEGIATTIIKQMEKHQERFKKIMREAQRDNS